MAESDGITRMYTPTGEQLVPVVEAGSERTIDPFALSRLDVLIHRKRVGTGHPLLHEIKFWIYQPDRPLKPVKEECVEGVVNHPITNRRVNTSDMSSEQIANFAEALAERPGLTIIYVG